MNRASGGAILFVSVALAASLALPARVHAVAVTKIKESNVKEHKSVHGTIGILTRKFGKDTDLKALIDAYHALGHKEMDAYTAVAENPSGDAKANLAKLNKDTHAAKHAMMDFVAKNHPKDRGVKSLVKFFHLIQHRYHKTKDKLL